MKPILASILAGSILALHGAACVALAPESSDEGTEGTVDQALLSGPVPYRGVSLASAEFAADVWGNGTFPGTHGVDYVYPDPAYASGYNSASYYVGKGMTAFRIPFRWERLQPTLGQALNSTELTRLTTTVNNIVAKGAVAVIDPHNYARYHTNLIGSASVSNAQFADFWSRLATTFKGNSKVIFALMNEPHDMKTEDWASSANAAIAAIRSAGAQNLILVPGNAYTGAHSWSESWYGTPNATAMLAITDPGNNYAFEVHQYLDSDSSGTHDTCVSGTVGSAALSGFTSWLKANGKRGFLGEFGGGANATCAAAIDDMLKHIEANSSVWLGWTNWAGGPWWGSYMLSIEPTGGNDTVQMKALLPHLAWTGGGAGDGGAGDGGGGLMIPAAPAGLSATAGNAQVTLNWTASAGATSYNVSRSTTNGGGYVSVATGLAGTSYLNTGLTNGTAYYYVVTATNAAGTSGNSNQATATPAGGGATPCAGAVTVTGGQSGNFNTTNAVCYRTADTINGWGCSNFTGRTVSINGSATTCGATPLPAKWADGYRYFSISAGSLAYASFYWW